MTVIIRKKSTTAPKIEPKPQVEVKKQPHQKKKKPKNKNYFNAGRYIIQDNHETKFNGIIEYWVEASIEGNLVSKKLFKSYNQAHEHLMSIQPESEVPVAYQIVKKFISQKV